MRKIRERLAEVQLQVLEDCGPDKDGEGEAARQKARKSRKRRANDAMIADMEETPEAARSSMLAVRRRPRTKNAVPPAATLPEATPSLTPFEMLSAKAHASHTLVTCDTLACCRRCGAITSFTKGRLILLAKPCNGVPNASGKANLEALQRGVNPLVPLRALRAAKAARRP